SNLDLHGGHLRGCYRIRGADGYRRRYHPDSRRRKSLAWRTRLDADEPHYGSDQGLQDAAKRKVKLILWWNPRMRLRREGHSKPLYPTFVVRTARPAHTGCVTR